VNNIRRRWPGVLLSIFVPGFGLVRAGMIWRGFAWFGSLFLVNGLVGISLALDFVPIVFGFLCIVMQILGYLAMLRDSFRVGRMTLASWGVFLTISILFLVLPLPYEFFVKSFTLSTSAMEPTLIGESSDGVSDHFLVDRITYRLVDPERGDLVVFFTLKSKDAEIGKGDVKFYVKRIIGLPGEHIEIRNGQVFANGEPLASKDGISPINYESPLGGKQERVPITLGDDEYFVIGDNSEVSIDSRHFGPVPETNLFGKVTKIYYPISRIGKPYYR